MRTRIKICGITRMADALIAAQCGADAIGLVFYAGSPRVVSLTTACDIAHAVPAFVSTVALFVNAARDDVQCVIDAIRPTYLQFHGDESEVFCKQFNVPYIRAFRVGPGVDLLQCAGGFSSANALLLDALVDGQYGGSGKTFDWSLIPESLREKIILSGGLTPETVANGVRQVRPWAVDVSSGVEQSKGIKDHMKIRKFIEEVRNADAL